MGLDLATLIAAMGLTTTGNPLSLNPGFSIGGKSLKSQNLLGNLLGLLGASTYMLLLHNGPFLISTLQELRAVSMEAITLSRRIRLSPATISTSRVMRRR